MANRSKKTYTLLMLLTSVIWGFGFIATAKALEAGYSTGFILMTRFVFATVVYGIMSGHEIIDTTHTEFLGGSIAGVFLFLGFTLQTYGLPLTTPSNNALFTASNVMFIPLFIWLIFKVKPNKKAVLGSALCFLGVVVLSVNFKEISGFGLGDTLSLLCAVSFALHNVLMSNYSVRGRVGVLNFYQMLTSGILATALFAISDRDMTQFAPKKEGLWVLYLCIFSTMIAYIIVTHALKHTTPLTVAIISAFESVTAVIFSVMFGYEGINLRLILGGLLIVLAMVAIESPSNEEKTNIQEANKP